MSVVPQLDLSRQYQQIRPQVEQAALEVLASGRYIGGTWVARFEEAFGQYVGTGHCIACNSGTDALYLALRALDIGPGDEVITSPFSFIATAEAISLVGATPVFVDIDLASFNLDPAQAAAAITPRTRALLPVHLFGRPADMADLLALAQGHQLAVIEDCAQATGATWAGRPVGSLGTVGCFSFYPTKNLGACGDGGAVTTDDPALAARLRQIKEHGQSRRYYSDTVGVNSRLDAIQAALLTLKLAHLDTWNAARQRVAEVYDQGLADCPGLVRPAVVPGDKARSVWNQYTVRILQDRDRVQAELATQGIGTALYYPIPIHLQPLYAALGYREGQLPQAEQAAREVLSLPMFPELTEAEQDQVMTRLKSLLAPR
ncbi:MAG: DegT/DnrJ/EryC1/StrS family aminotransferase [Gloeomargaritaceae cyanobacterium C42_A2020_066]|nr:DegT/DnrJ/EryC1/StrS family aminotransferase [Gloeomargaritaceae cyanobacterium C42_A2020_066]